MADWPGEGELVTPVGKAEVPPPPFSLVYWVPLL